MVHKGREGHGKPEHVLSIAVGNLISGGKLDAHCFAKSDTRAGATNKSFHGFMFLYEPRCVVGNTTFHRIVEKVCVPDGSDKIVARIKQEKVDGKIFDSGILQLPTKTSVFRSREVSVCLLTSVLI